MTTTLTRLRDLIAREPVVVRSAIGLLVSLGLVWGVDLAGIGERLAQTVDIVAALVVLVSLAWARAGATPAKTVVAVVQPDGVTVAGPASPLPDGTPVTPALTDAEFTDLEAVRDLLFPGDPGRDALTSVLEQARHLA